MMKRLGHTAANHSRLFLIAWLVVLVCGVALGTALFGALETDMGGSEGIVVERVLSDNGFCYRGKLFNEALDERSIVHKYCRPCRPQTNGKVERFHRTLLEEWAYVRPYCRESDRTRALAQWLHRYNHHRLHSGIGWSSRQSRHQPPEQHD